MSSKLLKGTAILTIGLFLSKALGLFYLIPFYAIVGEENIGLYQYAYIPYNIALSVAISGAPLAISKFVSKYNALGDYATGRKILRGSMGIMVFSGIASFLILFFLAEPIAHLVRTDDEQIFTVEEIAGVIRWVSYALLVVPMMSIIRGFLQGYNKMEPTAVSQLVEQIVRIAVVLIGGFIVVNFLHESPKVAVNFAVFAAAIGAVASLGVLYYYWRKYKPELDYLLAKSPPASDVTIKDMYAEVITYIIPFILVGVINPLYQFVDMITFNSAMKSIGLAAVSDTYLGMLNLLTHKFVMIPVMVATGFSMTLIPVITGDYTKKNQVGITRSLDQTYQIMLYLTVPMVIGLVLLSDELYQFLYSKSDVGAAILASYAPVAVLFGLYTVTAAILQGIDRHKWIVFTSLFGLLLKLMLNIPLIKLFETNGAIIATAIGYSAAVGLNILIITKTLHYHSKLVFRRLILIGILNVVMFIAVFFTLKGLNAVNPVDGKMHALLYILICAGVGVVVYGYLSLKTGLAQKLFGERLTRITNKLGL
ncbi:polysaccharide biosynthesis protein [Sporosarcina pasteurii]|uniref:Probable cell division protein ytgP n=1 Tax=Sporosarcina pasteurii TaxID=1474 RepID=A0A380C6B5_SPOPA|nr:polysaccharide biosynthesis protein [Sporosarcina pasteurii]MDS9471790.1 polysaccharide biosynthesis protein [Sporosarcina pasteurii]QBQ04616.1 polysaccharide biosynthesis protein [Sporosarcina pasteurii]SUJ13754.1 Probable cell division protein ytgP [Sporosarcina pasteurii]